MRDIGNLFEDEGPSQASDAFLGEDAPQPRQDQQPQPQPQPQKPSLRFVPDDFESPDALKQRRENLRQQYKQLNQKLDKSSAKDDTNPYIYTGPDGNRRVDEMAYNNDMRKLSNLQMEITDLSERLRDSRTIVESSMQQVKSYFANYFREREAKLKKHGLVEPAKRMYAEHFSNLVRSGTFNKPENMQPQALQSMAKNLFDASAGAAYNEAETLRPSKSPAMHDEDLVDDDEEDEFAGWSEGDKKMFQSWQKSQQGKNMTLADAKKAESQ